VNKNILNIEDFYLIAEIGGNHQGSFQKAKEICELAIESGSDCVKFQLYTAENLVNEKINSNRYKHFQKFELKKDEHIYLANLCIDSGLDYTASVWDLNMFEWIEPFLKFIKVGSGDLTSHNFLREFASTGKPIIISTGLSFMKEVENTINFLRDCNPVYKNYGMLSVMQCTSMYPIKDSDANLSIIKEFSKFENIIPGYSDHTIGIEALVYSLSFGAKILEFHFSDDKKNKTFRDHQVSLEIDDVKELSKKCKQIIKMIGDNEKVPLQIEIDNDHRFSFRRAIYPNKDIEKGVVISKSDIHCLRPNKGICASNFDLLIGKRSKIKIHKNQELDWDMFD
tara:strand:- start:1672 stop:2688 length:1017 start_codon:yes stop_codon:yes gene_type:complete